MSRANRGLIESSINPQSAIRNPQSQRLWRVRKEHASIDARLTTGDSEVELQYCYDGQPIVVTRWPTRAAAVADAEARLRDLQRVGWATHW